MSTIHYFTSQYSTIRFGPCYSVKVIEDFDKFRKEYEILNGNRTVNLRPQLGWVDLELELDNGACKTFKCSTGQAALIQLFHVSYTHTHLSSNNNSNINL